MKRIASVIIILVILIGLYINFLDKEPNSLIARFVYSKVDNRLTEFISPSGLVINNDFLYGVMDSKVNRMQVLKINSDGSLNPMFNFGKYGKALDELGAPLGLETNGKYLYVADFGNSRIQVLKINSDGSLNPKFSFGKSGKDLGEFGVLPSLVLPVGLAMKDNYLYVADSGNSRIQIFKINSDGSLNPKLSFGKLGKALGEFGVLSSKLLSFSAPLGLAIKGNYLFIADSGNSRIQVLKINSDGSLNPKFSFGKPGKNLGEFGAPLGLAVKDNYLFIADSGNSRIQVLKINSDGSLNPKFSFGKPGKDLGEFGGDNHYLTSLTIKDNFLYVADTGNDRIQVLEIKY